MREINMDEHEADAAVSAGITPGNILNDGLVAEGGGWLYYADAYDGGWLYYADAYDGGKLYKARADGSDRARLSDDEYCVYINVSGGWVYYRAGIKKSVLKIRADGSERTVLTDEAGNFMTVAGELIYYTDLDGSGTGDGYLHRMKTDGSEKPNSNIFFADAST